MNNDNAIRELANAAAQILGDVESMGAGSPEEYGGFSDWRETSDGETVIISWPNLAISARRLRAALGRVVRDAD
jgi:hypothetical protein